MTMFEIEDELFSKRFFMSSIHLNNSRYLPNSQTIMPFIGMFK